MWQVTRESSVLTVAVSSELSFAQRSTATGGQYCTTFRNGRTCFGSR